MMGVMTLLTWVSYLPQHPAGANLHLDRQNQQPLLPVQAAGRPLPSNVMIV